MRLTVIKATLLVITLSVFLAGCGFKLRDTTPLPEMYRVVGLSGASLDDSLGKTLSNAFIDARSQLVVDKALPTQLIITTAEEGRRVASYGSDLSVRQYLVFLLVDYQIVVSGKVVAEHRLKIDKTMNYDSDFVLGKQEEERQIQQAHQQEAARLILLRLKSLKP